MRGQDADVLRIGGYRLFFYSFENDGPPHIHIERGEAVAKLWLHPVTFVKNSGFRRHELSKLRLLMIEHRSTLQEAWNPHFGQDV